MALNSTGRPWAPEVQAHGYPLAVAYSVVFTVGLGENVVAASFLLSRLPRSSPSSVLLLSMTVATTVFTCALPLQIDYHLHGGDWSFGELACRLSSALLWAFMQLSTASFFCLCLYRSVALAYPFTCLRLRRVHWAAGSAALWLLAGGTAIPVVLGGPLSWTRPDNRTSCFENTGEDTGSGSRGPSLVLCTILLGSYGLLGWRVASGYRGWHCRRALRTLCFSTLICTLCFLPHSLTHLLHHLPQPTPFLSRLQQVTRLLVSLGACLNPTICLPWAPRAAAGLWARLCSCRARKVFTIYDGKLVGPSYPPTRLPPTGI